MSCRMSPSILMCSSVLTRLPVLAHCQYSLLTAGSGWSASFKNNSVTEKTDTGESCCAESSQAQRGKNGISAVAGSFPVIHCVAAGLTALLLQVEARSVCFRCLFHCQYSALCQSQRQGTLTQRQTDDGNLWCARWGCVIQY